LISGKSGLGLAKTGTTAAATNNPEKTARLLTPIAAPAPFAVVTLNTEPPLIFDLQEHYRNDFLKWQQPIPSILLYHFDTTVRL
jgi:hypothetical protein